MPVKVFLTIRVESSHVEEIRSKLKALPEVSLVCSIDRGSYDIIAIIEVDSFETYRAFSIDKLGKMSYLEDYTSFIALGV